MVNGTYIVYGDRPSSESEFVDDHHIRTETAERKSKRKKNRTANELESSLNQANQKDNLTDSIKYEKARVPRLLRYVPTTAVEEHFVAENFETYYMKPGTEEQPRRCSFIKKPRNPADGSVNYGYTRSCSSSPNASLPTISEQSEPFGIYRDKAEYTAENYKSKFDKYFIRATDKKVKYDGSHPDSLHRVPNLPGAGVSRMVRVLKMLRWPAALIVVCAALGLSVYYLLLRAGHIDSQTNSTFWEAGLSSAISSDSSAPQLFNRGEFPSSSTSESTSSSEASSSLITEQKTTKKPVEIDFYNPDKFSEIITIIDSISEDNRRPAIAPVYPDHISPEVQYGDNDKGRTPKHFDDKNKLTEDSTLKPHITQKPERPLAIFFNRVVPNLAGGNPETLNRAETGGATDSKLLDKITKSREDLFWLEDLLAPESEITSTTEEVVAANRNFTSGHSKVFGVGIEDLDRMKSTTQSSVYNTRVSPTLPTWRNAQDTTTKNYPVNSAEGHYCRSPSLKMCRGLLPYDLAGPMLDFQGISSTQFTKIILMVANCSARIRQFACALLEPECQPPPLSPTRPCRSLCHSALGPCQQVIPDKLLSVSECNALGTRDCFSATAPCYADEISCRDGTCVSKNVVCDGVRDCRNGEDERNCGSCDKNQYRCPSSGECIKKSWLCDGVNDCPNREDEDPRECQRLGIPVYTKPTSIQFGTSERYETGDAEDGEEGAGSAPAATVTRYSINRSPHDLADDSSKELLETSDTSNALRRNFSRNTTPSLLRLTPYKIKGPIALLDEFSRQNAPQPSRKMQSRKKTLNLEESNERPDTIEKIQEETKARLLELSKLRRMRIQNQEYLDKGKRMRSSREEETEPTRVVNGRSSPCAAGELRCVDGRCITLAMLCDGNVDCSDRADEDNCYTTEMTEL